MAKIKKKYENEYLIKCNSFASSTTRWWIRYYYSQFGRLNINKDKTYTLHTNNSFRYEYRGIEITKIS